ncbi:MAG: FtsX-like permease family protein [Candidatus Asgardarchaeum sp.]
MKLLLLTKRMLIRAGGKTSLAVIALAAGTGTLTASGILHNVLTHVPGAIILENMILIMGLSSLLMGSIFVFFIMFNMFIDRREIIGVLKTIGYPNKFILHLFVLQGALLGFAGSLIGVVFGSNFVISLIFGWRIYIGAYPFSREYPYTAWSGFIFIIGLLLPTLLSYYVAMKAAEIPIVTALSHVPIFYEMSWKFLSSFNKYRYYALRRILRNPILYILLFLISLITMLSTTLTTTFSIVCLTNLPYYRQLLIYIISRAGIIISFIIVFTGSAGYYAIWKSENVRRKMEISVMKTIGWTNKDIIKITLYELLFIVFAPYLISIVLSISALIFIYKITNITILLISFTVATSIAAFLLVLSLLVIFSTVKKSVIENLKILEMELLAEFR